VLKLEVGGVMIGGERCYNWRWEVLQLEVGGVTIGGERCYDWR